MFSSSALFKDIACPEFSKCSLLNCIFSHQLLHRAKENPGIPQGSSVPVNNHASVAHAGTDSQDDSPENSRPRKKRRFDNDETNETKYFVGSQSKKSALKTPVSSSHDFLIRRETIQDSGTKLSQGGLSTDKMITPIGTETIKRASDDQPKNNIPETTLKRKFRDPKDSDLGSMQKIHTKSSDVATGAQPAQEDKKEPLNPRMIVNPPASHAIRVKLVKLLHQYISMLNDQTKLSKNPSHASIILNPQQLTTEALDIEASIAEKNPFVYQNVLKQRIMSYRNMKQEDWAMERLAKNPKPKTITVVNPTPPPRIETGLSSKDELAFLPRIHADLALLSAFNYMTSAPTHQEMEEAIQGVEAAHHWEVCARCETRFQVFPGRRPEDGATTTGGPCRYHWGKRCRMPSGEYGFTCCRLPAGTEGCRPAHTHVFKVSDPKRLAAIMPFLETPENSARLSEEAVAFDCEMGYTTLGMELIRLTAISWPTGAQLVDVLVRPLGEILDLNGTFSGVWQDDYAKALEATLLGSADHESNPSRDVKTLKVMESPAEARALLFKYISPTTSLIGHALENDLKAIRIIHPCIVDTVDLFPHCHGLPKRNSLRVLSKNILDREIQTGVSGHDSHEDARAAGDLVRMKIQEVVKRWKAGGYNFGDGEFPPIEADLPTPLRKSS